MDDKIFGQIEALVGLMSNLQDTVGSLNTTANTFATSVQDLTSVIGNAESGMENFNSTLSTQQEAFAGVKDAAEAAAGSVNSYNKLMEIKTKAVQKDLIKRYGAFVDSNTSIGMAALNKLTGGFLQYAKQQSEIFNRLESERQRFFFAFDMFKSQFSFFAGVGASLFNIFKGLMTALLNVGKLLITLPLKTLETMLDIAHSIREEYLAISQTLEDTQENFSLMSKQGQGFIRLTSQIRGLGTAFLDVNSEAAKTFGFGLEGQKAMAAAVRETVTAMGSLGNLYSDAYQDNGIIAERALRSLGMSVEDNMFMMRKSMSEGIHPFSGLSKAIHASNQAQIKFGIDQKQVAKGMNVLRKNVIEFSHLSEQEFANVTAQAARLGVEAEGLVAIFNKFTTFESAAESAALLSQTFGMAIDAMDIIRAEDPMEILNQFREGMIQTGRDFRDLNRHEKALLSQYTGLNGEMLQTAMSFEGIGLSYQELQQKMKESSPENQLKEAVKEMSGSIKEFMNVGKKLTSPFQAIAEGMKDALVKNGQFQRSMMGLSSSIQRMYSRVLSRFVSKGLLSSVEKIVNLFGGLINNKVTDGFVDLAQKIAKFLEVALSIKPAAEDMSKAFNDVIKSFFTNPFVDKLVELGKVMIGNIVRGFLIMLPDMLTGFRDLLRFFNKSLDGQSVENEKSGLGKWFREYVADAWEDVKDQVGGPNGLFNQLLSEFNKALGVSTSFFFDMGMEIGSGIIKGILNLAWNNLGATIGLSLGVPLATTVGTLLFNKLKNIRSSNSLMNEALSGMEKTPSSGVGDAITKTAGGAAAGGAAAKSGGKFLSALKTGGKFLGGTLAAVGTAFSLKEAIDKFGAGDTTGGLIDSVATAAGAVALAGITGFVGAPLAAIATGVGAVAAGVSYFRDSNKQSSDESRKQTEETRKVAEAVKTQAAQPFVINLSINQSLDGDELTNKILSAAINGTTQFNINTDDAGRMQLLSRNANDAGGYNPVPQA